MKLEMIFTGKDYKNVSYLSTDLSTYLLIGGDSFLILDLLLHVVDAVRGLHLEGDSLASQGLDEDLHVACCYC